MLEGKLSGETKMFKKIDEFFDVTSCSLLKTYPTTAPCYAGEFTPNLLWASIAPDGV